MKRCHHCQKLVDLIEVDVEYIDNTKSLLILACDNCKTPIKIQLTHPEDESNKIRGQFPEPKQPELPYKILPSRTINGT